VTAICREREQKAAAEVVGHEEGTEETVREVKGVVGRMEIMDVRVANGAEPDPELVRAVSRAAAEAIGTVVELLRPLPPERRAEASYAVPLPEEPGFYFVEVATRGDVSCGVLLDELEGALLFSARPAVGGAIVCGSAERAVARVRGRARITKPVCVSDQTHDEQRRRGDVDQGEARDGRLQERALPHRGDGGAQGFLEEGTPQGGRGRDEGRGRGRRPAAREEGEKPASKAPHHKVKGPTRTGPTTRKGVGDMAASLNRVILAGNLTRDPELRFTNDGIPVCNFGLAVNRRRSKDDDAVDFFDVNVWREQGEAVANYKTKGDPVLVEGRLQYRSWEDKESGQKRSKVDIVADNVQFLGSANGNGNGSSGGSGKGSAPAGARTGRSQDADLNEDDFSDIPF
jgi:single-strand DNA-binding protein